MVLRAAIDSLAAVLFPAPCRICDATLLMASRVPIGAACFAWFEPIRQPMCALWQAVPTAPAAESVQPICRLCRDNYDTFDFARSYGVYKDALHHRNPLAEIRGSHSLWGLGLLTWLRASLRRSGRRWLCPFRCTL